MPSSAVLGTSAGIHQNVVVTHTSGKVVTLRQRATATAAYSGDVRSLATWQTAILAESIATVDATHAQGPNGTLAVGALR